MKTIHSFSNIFKALVIFSGLLFSSLSFASVETATNENDVILSGYDTVTYFTQTAPSLGKPSISSVYNGAIYHFTSEKNRDTFKANPAKYAPQYGGFCAYGATFSKKIDVDPTAYEIVDGKLYVQSNDKVLKTWQPEKSSLITDADKKWKKIKDVPADKL